MEENFGFVNKLGCIPNGMVSEAELLTAAKTQVGIKETKTT